MISIQAQPGRPQDAEKTLADYYRDAYCPLYSPKLSASRQANFNAAIAKLDAYLERPAKLADLSNEHILGLLEKMAADGLNPETAASYRNALKELRRSFEKGPTTRSRSTPVARLDRRTTVAAKRPPPAVSPPPITPEMTLGAFITAGVAGGLIAKEMEGRLRRAVTAFDLERPRPTTVDALSEQLVTQWHVRCHANGTTGSRLTNHRIALRRLWQAACDAGIAPPLPARIGLNVKASDEGWPPPLPIGASEFGEEMTVRELICYFIRAQEGRVSSSRMHGTRFYLRDFDKTLGHLMIDEMRVAGVYRVEAWVKSHTGWHGCRASVVSRIKQLFKWGADQGMYAGSPIHSLKRPKDNSRVAYFTPEQVEAILNHGSEDFKTAFRALLATGCRPNELATLTADDVERKRSGEVFWMVHHKNERHTLKKRRIYLTDEAREITESQLRRYPTGRVFRSASNGAVGSPLSETYLNHALRKVCQWADCRALGLDEHDERRRSNGTQVRLYKYVAYTARHTFAVRYLTGFYRNSAGQPIILGYPEVAAYMGNSAAMVEKIYGHLTEQTEFLSARLRGEPVAGPNLGQ